MKPDKRFLGQVPAFWANVRAISETVGYSVRGKGVIQVPTLPEMISAMRRRSLSADHLVGGKGAPTPLGTSLCKYFSYRARVLNNYIEPRLMDGNRPRP